MNRLTTDISSIVRHLPVVKIGLLSMLVAIFSATAMAQCGGSFSALAVAAASVRSQSSPSASPSSVQNQSAAANDNAVNTSIVGLWHIRFLVGGQLFQEAFQIWNTGGTEVHNPNVDPRQGNVCLGTWTETAPLTFKLAHRVYLYDTEGHFMAVGHLTETLTLGDRGNTHSGTFTIQAYDLAGNPLGGELLGTVIGERISAN